MEARTQKMEVSRMMRNELKWTTELEVALFHSMHSHKPVGMLNFCLHKPDSAVFVLHTGSVLVL